jgi:hypothetical protein
VEVWFPTCQLQRKHEPPNYSLVINRNVREVGPLQIHCSGRQANNIDPLDESSNPQRLHVRGRVVVRVRSKCRLGPHRSRKKPKDSLHSNSSKCMPNSFVLMIRCTTRGGEEGRAKWTRTETVMCVNTSLGCKGYLGRDLHWEVEHPEETTQVSDDAVSIAIQIRRFQWRPESNMFYSLSPLRKKVKPADSLLVACENQRDNAGSGIGAAGCRIGRCTVLNGLTPDNAA